MYQGVACDAVSVVVHGVVRLAVTTGELINQNICVCYLEQLRRALRGKHDLDEVGARISGRRDSGPFERPLRAAVRASVRPSSWHYEHNHLRARRLLARAVAQHVTERASEPPVLGAESSVLRLGSSGWVYRRTARRCNGPAWHCGK